MNTTLMHSNRFAQRPKAPLQNTGIERSQPFPTECALPAPTLDVLIVDDHPDNLRTLAGILGREGYRIRKATNGEIALLTAETEPPDLILMDVQMPGMDGYAVCQALKANPVTEEIPVIFLSAADDVEAKVKAFEVGGVDYITKPFRSEEVLVRIRQQLTLRQQSQQLQAHNQRLQIEIQVRQQAEAETQLLLATIQAVSQAINFEQALVAVLREVNRAIAWDYGEAWIPAADNQRLQFSQACFAAHDSDLQQFAHWSQQFTFATGEGIPGLVWDTQQLVWVEDLVHMPLTFSRQPLAIAAGLVTVFGVPIIVEGRLLAVLSFYSRSLMAQEPKVVQLVNAIALQLGSFMQRKQMEAELTQANRELQRLVNLDGLTGIANRRCFDATLQQEWLRLRRYQMPLSLILCDVDCFKAYNDCYGHLAGDDCLRQVAQTLAGACQRSADLVARYGGEEFVLLLPATDTAGAICLIETIQTQLQQVALPHSHSAIADHITISAGIATLIPSGLQEPSQLIEYADEALYQAKSQGRNRYCCATSPLYAPPASP